MVLRWILLLVFLLSTGLAQKNCNRPRVTFPAPDFSGGENLSLEECGYWDQQKNENAPWFALIRLRNVGVCRGSIISATTFLSIRCNSEAEEFAKSENKDYWAAHLGKCALTENRVKCVENGKGQFLKIKNVTKLNAPGYPWPLHIWKIENATLKENSIAPICISNNGNRRNFVGTQQYTVYDFNWKRDWNASAEMSEDFGPCLRTSRNFTTCENVHDNFLCANLSKEDYVLMPYLTQAGVVRGKRRNYLRALRIENNHKSDIFFYEISALLQQIEFAMPKDSPKID